LPTKLNWSALEEEDFERLLFVLISDTPGYENPEWLQHTNAPDRGRDLAVTRVESDPLLGVKRHRTIIQCKHWLKRSVSIGDVGDLRAQLTLLGATTCRQLDHRNFGPLHYRRNRIRGEAQQERRRHVHQHVAGEPS
jgi:hypothetical protein